MLERPKRKNPVLRTRLPTLPPAARSRIALGLTAAAALGRFELQQCRDCGTVQYPPREACQGCLSIRLEWKPQSPEAELLAATVLHHSNDLFFRERLPWRLGLVRLDCGPTVVAHLHERVAPAPSRVIVAAKLDRAGQAVLVALPDKEANMAEDRQLREFTCDPKSRHDRMRRFERWNDSFQFGAKAESFERFGVAGVDVFGPSAVMKICVLRTDRCVIEASRNRMSRCNLSALILKHV